MDPILYNLSVSVIAHNANEDLNRQHLIRVLSLAPSPDNESPLMAVS